MKRVSVILLVLILASTSFGCAAQENKKKNDVFTDAFFLNVVEIRDSRYGQVSLEQMEPVISFLKVLKLSPTDEHLRSENETGDPLYGVDYISFIKSDGSEIVFARNHATMSSSEGYSYVVEGENLNEGLETAFKEAFNYSSE